MTVADEGLGEGRVALEGDGDGVGGEGIGEFFEEAEETPGAGAGAVFWGIVSALVFLLVWLARKGDEEGDF